MVDNNKNILVKVCVQCKEEKPVEDFPFHFHKHRMKFYLQGRCKECVTNYNKNYRKENNIVSIYDSEKYKSYYNQNKEKILASRRKSFLKNKEKVYARMQRWRDRNPDKIKAQNLAKCERSKQRKEKKKKWGFYCFVYGKFDTSIKNLTEESKRIIVATKLIKSKRTYEWQKKVYKLMKVDVDHALEAVYKSQITKKENLLWELGMTKNTTTK